MHLQGAKQLHTNSQLASGRASTHPAFLYLTRNFLETGPITTLAVSGVNPLSSCKPLMPTPNPEPLRQASIGDRTNPRMCRRSGLVVVVFSCHCSPPFAGSLSCFLACLRTSREGPSGCSADREYRSKREFFSNETARRRHRHTSTLRLLGSV